MGLDWSDERPEVIAMEFFRCRPVGARTSKYDTGVGRLEGWKFQPKQTSGGFIKNATNTVVAILT
ncbi:hypothetical protein Taro_038398 [Colocasia esculenta]|uniref:Uncharacterized protein n=1 Tax=Colocasia esculenta TaxID=4460 RepID=A0A843W3D2_COLES|nr:hypothetical protein [Colocasia esculenta]